MVAKINNGSSLYGALAYNQEKVDEGTAHVLYKNKIIDNFTGNNELDLHYTIKSFENYIYANPEVKKPVVHISLNPDPSDKLTDEDYSKLAKDYMDKINFGNQPYIVYKHEDIDRHHIHIITVRTDETGKRISDSYEHVRSMDACRELEIKYGLKPALKKEKEFYTGFLKKIDYEKGNIKGQISNILKTVTKGYKYQSFGEFNALLSCYNIDIKHVKGMKFDREYNGIIYSVKDDKGKIVSNPFKSSLFGKPFGFEAINRLLVKNAQIFKDTDYFSKPKDVISNAMKNIKSKEGFINQLNENGLDVVFRKNDSGRIYGVTFIDHKNKTVFNGSRLGKEFSANVFNELMRNVPEKGDRNEIPLSPQLQAKEKQIPDTVNLQTSNFLENHHLSNEQDKANNSKEQSSSIENILDILDLRPQGDDFEEIQFTRRMRRKKKKGRKV